MDITTSSVIVIAAIVTAIVVAIFVAIVPSS
jgi:hypothetical protein